jgi:hypothetical protein
MVGLGWGVTFGGGGIVIIVKSARFELLKSDIALEDWRVFANTLEKEEALSVLNDGYIGGLSQSSAFDQRLGIKYPIAKLFIGGCLLHTSMACGDRSKGFVYLLFFVGISMLSEIY